MKLNGVVSLGGCRFGALRVGEGCMVAEAERQVKPKLDLLQILSKVKQMAS